MGSCAGTIKERYTMARRKRTRSTASMVQVIFDPAGDIHVRAVAPSGNVYEIKPRTPFQVASEDVDWLFRGWEAQHRQCLSLADEYQPRRAQFDNGEANRKARAVVAPEPVVEPELVLELPAIVEVEPEPEPVVEPEPNIEPEPVVEADADETVTDKE
jgi:hypothetical protein